MTFCWKCAAPGIEIDIVRDGETVDTGSLCDTCFAAALKRYEEAQAEFQALLDAGVSRADANTIMIRRYEHERRSEEVS